MLSKIDVDFFKNPQVWEHLVRAKTNQFGRDLKKREIVDSDQDRDLDSDSQEVDENEQEIDKD